MKRLNFLLVLFFGLLFAACSNSEADPDRGRQNQEAPEQANCGGGCKVNLPDWSNITYELADGTICEFLAPPGITLDQCELISATGPYVISCAGGGVPLVYSCESDPF